ncbi:hypothetical protein XM25_11980 [Devosia sp. H5989]|nr:hypothetical protein XM25_11980 [Devosia sp. H5989]
MVIDCIMSSASQEASRMKLYGGETGSGQPKAAGAGRSGDVRRDASQARADAMEVVQCADFMVRRV